MLCRKLSTYDPDSQDPNWYIKQLDREEKTGKESKDDESEDIRDPMARSSTEPAPKKTSSKKGKKAPAGKTTNPPKAEDAAGSKDDKPSKRTSKPTKIPTEAPDAEAAPKEAPDPSMQLYSKSTKCRIPLTPIGFVYNSYRSTRKMTKAFLYGSPPK